MAVSNTDKKYKSITAKQIRELSAIYDDYLYITRQHEYLVDMEPLDELADRQKEHLSPDVSSCPWQIRKMTQQEQSDFHNVINNDAYDIENKTTYIKLRHVKTEENREDYDTFAVPPYKIHSFCMQLPSWVERWSALFPTTGTLGDNEFFVDGLYRAVYTGKSKKDMLLQDVFGDADIMVELTLMINLVERLRKINYIDGKIPQKEIDKVYAEESVLVNENIILELLGSFAEKLLIICREIYLGQKEKYTKQDNIYTLRMAEKEGLINSAADMQDYVNIRHLLRHQWDTLDELGHFTPRGSIENKNTRDEYVASYLKICDKTIKQRMKSYIDILSQMQHVMNTLKPNRVMRAKDESNNKFIKRVRSITVNYDTELELNYRLHSDKYNSLINNLYKIFPGIQIADLYFDMDTRQKKMDEYYPRTCFLQRFLIVECMAMRYCRSRGNNFKNIDAWKTIQDMGIITPEQADRWHGYAILRNKLSHNYFDDDLRKRLFDKLDTYEKDADFLQEKLCQIGPEIRKIRPYVHEYTHSDGLVVQLDLKHHEVLHNSASVKIQQNKQIKGNKMQTPETQKEVCTNGIEFTISDQKIICVKLPNGVSVNLSTQSIDWDILTHWYTDNKYFNVLQTDKSKITMDKDLRATEYIEKNRKRPVRASDSWLLDGRHPILFDSVGRIKEFKFKNFRNNIVQTAFVHKKDGRNLIIFADGTTISQLGNQMTITHDGKELTFANRQEFAATYIVPQTVLQQKTPNINVR